MHAAIIDHGIPSCMCGHTVDWKTEVKWRNVRCLRQSSSHSMREGPLVCLGDDDNDDDDDNDH